ncbi:MAG TPA: M56 family metallopeptidase [Terriglobales bacterium]|nr:M56 family metallopeptidase [Terriglobales bacterium]
MLAGNILQVNDIAQASTARMLNGIAEGVTIACLAWILLRVVGRQNSGTRFVVWFVALLGIVALPVFQGTSAHGSSAPGAALTLPGSWALGLFVLWAVIAVGGFVRLAMGLWRLHGLRRSGRPLQPDELHPSLHDLVKRFQAERDFQLCTSDRVHVPTALGFWNPAIVLPGWTVRELSQAELRAVLMHEFAHLRRWDDWSNLVQKILGALFFFHPAVWWVEKHLALEREMACDEHVLAGTENPRAYAECLVSLAEKGFLRRGVALAHAAVSRLSQTAARVARILDARKTTGTRVATPVVATLGAVLVSCGIGVHHVPALIGFQNPRQAVSTPNLPASNLAQSYRDPGRFAQVVPTKLTSMPTVQRQKSMRAGCAAKAAHPAPTFTNVRSHNFENVHKANVQRANLRIMHNLAPVAVLVVMEGRQLDSTGSMFWQISVYRLTVFHPDDKIANQPAAVSKST